jgi:hypothetical protein
MNKPMEREQRPAETTKWVLPPLILHPFTGDCATDQLVVGSRAMLSLHGMLPSNGTANPELEILVRRGRLQEIRMLYFLGKDLLRWVDQCTDFASREPALKQSGLRAQSFAALLVESTPPAVAQKMVLWGVTDHKSVFSRAIGLNICFAAPPVIDMLATAFMDHYHRFADYLFICYQTMAPYLPAPPDRFDFRLYASAEYAGILEQQFLTDH